MKRRIMALGICLMLLFSLFGGCQKADKADDSRNTDGSSAVSETNADEGSADVTEAPDNTGSSDEQTAGPEAYRYEQELNIIDDNFRNYYEIFVYSYCDSNGDGIGDINGIISKLDYIADLGFNGIWLMPVMPSPSYHKYDVTDYYNVDPAYGTLDDFKNLVTECGKRGIKLIIDFVFNHTSAQHPWFKEAVSYLESLKKGEEPDLTVCPYVGYYHFIKDSKGAPGFYPAGSSDWYYEGKFWDQMPDLALESDAVRKEIEKAAKFWLDLGVGGFRLDAAKEYFSGETSKNVEVLKWFTEYVKSINKDAYLVGEVWDTEAAIASYYASGITSLFDYPMALNNGVIVSAVRKLGSSDAAVLADTIVRFRDDYSKNNPAYIDAPFISNHDNTRISAQCVNDGDQMKMAAGVLLTLSGSPFVYYGDEVGMNSQGSKDENKRLPMHWSDTDQTGIPMAPPGADAVTQKFAAVDQQENDPLSILNYYKRAVRLRNENPEIARGTDSIVTALTNQDIMALEKNYNGSKIVIVYNINTEAAEVSLKTAGYDNLSIRGYLSVDGSEVTLTDGTLNLPKYSIVVLK